MLFLSEDSKDVEEIGNVGNLRGGADNYSIIWQIVRYGHVTLEDIKKNWTFEHMNSFAAYLQMENDLKNAWRAFFNEKEKNNMEALNYGR